MTGNYHSHAGIFLAGLGGGAIIISGSSWADAAMFAGATYIGSLLPDADMKGTKITKYFGFLNLINGKMKHRGFSHSLFCVALLSFLTYLLFFVIFKHIESIETERAVFKNNKKQQIC